ncbi:hypothetical protein DH2020_005282 [Rehmannia glutinosa]|uniref:Uncharacterized protein n=1 Tax=Rehmannia glutinosa TaxID=99300 RepID=A0ABR0XFK2_REHGL
MEPNLADLSLHDDEDDGFILDEERFVKTPHYRQGDLQKDWEIWLRAPNKRFGNREGGKWLRDDNDEVPNTEEGTSENAPVEDFNIRINPMADLAYPPDQDDFGNQGAVMRVSRMEVTKRNGKGVNGNTAGKKQSNSNSNLDDKLVGLELINMELKDLKVNDLFIPGCREWDLELVEEIFCHRDAQQIANIPLAERAYEDTHVWHFDKKGNYTVKSGYRMAANLATQNSNTSSGYWRKLWSIQIPPKVKHFVWKVSRDCIPTRVNLVRKNIMVDQCCVICQKGLENCWHVFLSCDFAAGCWEYARLKREIDKWMDITDSFADFLHNILLNVDSNCAAKICMVMWNIWRQRNSELWDKNHLSATQTVIAAVNYLNEWRKVRIGDGSSFQVERTTRIRSQWQKPTFPFLKCNVDASLCMNSKSTGVGMVLRNDEGDFLVARTMVFHGQFQIREAEAIGVREALSWIIGMGFGQAIVETDAKVVVDALAMAKNGDSEYDIILSDCRMFLSSEPDLSVAFVGREGNTVAHELAKSSFSFVSPSVWTSPPPCIESLLLDDYAN